MIPRLPEPAITTRRLRFFPLVTAVVCGFICIAALFAQSPVQTCTVASISGVPTAGVACGGSSHGLNCTAGALYNCKSGPAGTQNNCTLSQACAIGCVANGAPNPLADTCFSGPSPITVSPLSALGGDDLAVTVQLTASHPAGAYVNLSIDRGDVVPGSYCAPPFQLAPGQTSASFGLSSAVVTSPTPVHIYTNLAYSDASGVSRQVVSIPQVVTLNPGGTEPPLPTLASFTLSPSTIAPGGASLMDVTLTRMAPARGVNIIVSSGNPSVASVIPGGQPTVLGSCLTSEGGSFAVQAANSVPQQTTVTISASSGAVGQAPLTLPLTVTAGCIPVACSGGPSCGPQPDGCGGTETCGCTNLGGQTCGGGGVPGMCGPFVLAVTGLTLNPATVIAGNSSIGTFTLNGAAPAGGALVSLSSTNSFVTVPDLVTVPAGRTSFSFTANTTFFTAGQVFAQISAAKGDTVNANMTVNAPVGTCTPSTCATLGKNCGSLSDGCGGTLSCGSCSAPQSCGGGGVVNVCGGSASTATLTLSTTGRNGTVTSTPAGLNVSTGHTASANFTAGTTITLQSSDSRGVVWSGVCSSGGKTTSKCSFTLNATGSETAKLQ
jgi:hypothetical protein